jgi:glucokinase
MKILSIDIGGTKILAALARRSGSTWVLEGRVSLASRDVQGLPDAVDRILAAPGLHDAVTQSPIDGVAIGAAGPVQDNVARLTNLSWDVDGPALAARLRSQGGRDLGRGSAFSQKNSVPVLVMNDLAAHGWGLSGLPPGTKKTLHPGTPKATGHEALLAVGTGVGEAILVWNGSMHTPLASEGSHASFAPVTSGDVKLLEFVWRKHHHVSQERMLGGRDGFRNLIDFHLENRRLREDSALALACMDQEDCGPALLSAAGKGDADALGILHWWIRLVGAEASNLVLKGLATGGLWLGGGVIARLLDLGLLDQRSLWDAFMRGFSAKGRFKELLLSTPIHVVSDPDNALRGAAEGLWRASAGLPPS